jgi:dihydroflavonol-4-reductase
MKVLVTGATGFIGANLVRELLKQNYQVKALVRQHSNQKNIEGLNIDTAHGDLRDRLSLDSALEDCEALFHVAASYTFWTRRPAEIYESNVGGTENILAAALTKGVKKVVYTSTESTIGVDKGSGLGTEEMEINPDTLAGDYKKSKLEAERLALKMYGDGLPVVIVNPTMPVGPFDIKPTPSGKLIVDFLNRKMPAYVNTGLNIIDVEDVAKGHILALEKGRPGERYILGNRNLTLKDIFIILEGISEIKAPRIRIPIWFTLFIAHIDEFISGNILKRPPKVPLAGVKTSRKFRHFDCSKAINELGLPQTPVEEAFIKATEWYKDNGYIN